MPQYTRDAMTEAETQLFAEYFATVNDAVEKRQLTVQFTQNPEGIHSAAYSINSNSSGPANAEQAVLNIVQLLNDGKITSTGGRFPIFKPATVTITHHMPMAWFTPDQEQAFNQAIEAINSAQRLKHCVFDSLLSADAYPIFRYSVSPAAPDPTMLHDAIQLVIQSIHDGKAIRIEMPDGGTMLTPRWPAPAPT